MGRSARTASLLTSAMLAVSCGGARHSSEPLVPTSATTPAVTAEPDAEAATRVASAPGAQLAAGRLGSTLDGLTLGSWSLPGRFGGLEGRDASSDHTLVRRTETGTAYTLHVLAWDSFAPSPSPLDAAAAAAGVRLRDTIALEAGDPDLAVAGVLDPRRIRDRDAGPERWIEWDSGASVVAQLVVAVRGGSVVHVSLVCEARDPCTSVDHTPLVRELARSLRRGPPLVGGGTWALRLPHDARTDRVATIALPPDLIALPPRSREDAILTPVVSLSSGQLALEVVMRVSMEPGAAITLVPGARSEPIGAPQAEAHVPCGPFSCVARFTEEGSRAALWRAMQDAHVVEVPADERTIALVGGRLRLSALGTSIDDVWHDETHEYEDGGPSDHHDHHVRIGAGLVHLDVADTLRPASELAAHAGASAEVLEASDASLRILRRAREAPPDRTDVWPVVVEHLVVAEQGGTLLEIDVLCVRDEPCVADDPSGLAELARRLTRGEPHTTASSWRIALARRTIELTLPDGYVLDGWNDPNHGGWTGTATHIGEPYAELIFEDSGAAPEASVANVGRPIGARTTLRLGTERFTLIARRGRRGETAWATDLGCGEGACVIIIRTESLPERDRLLSALAAATVTLEPPCTEAVVIDETALNVRQAPSARAGVVGTIEVDAEVTIAETRGRWSRLSAPLAGWVWDAMLARTCE